jgi:hypothetical protein
MVSEMDTLRGLIFNNWPRKVLALITALIIWLFVNSSIVETKTIPNVPIRITNIPTDKTIMGLLPNGMLSKRVTLTLSGTKDVVQELEAGDLEVLLDASTANSDEWVVQISKKNLVSLNPSIDLYHHVTQVVSHSELVLKISPLKTAKIPLTILPPIGDAPPGYEFLDVWPQHLQQTIIGPEEEIQALLVEGLQLTFNLADISKADLDAIKVPQSSMHSDEVSFPIPDAWKVVEIPCHTLVKDDLNDPDARYLRIDFLKKQFLPIEKEVPIRVFYPLKFLDTINPIAYPLLLNEQMREKNEVKSLTVPLFLKDVSKLFLNIIRDNMELTIVAAPITERSVLQWSLEVTDAHELEDVYAAFLLTNSAENKVNGSIAHSRQREMMLRSRFKEYMNRLRIYRAPDQKLYLDSRLETNGIKLSPIGGGA